MKFKLTVLAAALAASPAFAATWTTTIDEATYGSVGTITFDDHGYAGPTVGGYTVGANDFQVGGGFNAASVGQIQNVVTHDPDWQTSDPADSLLADFTFFPKADGSNVYNNANMDGTVNFYQWGYTTVGGSTFNKMTIDTAGNYYVAKNDMSFQYYDVFKYNNGTDPIQTLDTKINFQPYAVSNASGWCGSVLAESPTSLERMAGQVKFDFAFDVYYELPPGSSPVFASTEIIPDFVMRSYGSYVVDVTTQGGIGDQQYFVGSAVENNTNPETGLLDADWQNQVSFLGAGVIPVGAWVLNDGTANVQVVDENTAGATWHENTFAGYAFLLRADGTRTLTYVNPAGFSDYAATVPEPESYAMMLAGVALVGGVAARRRRQVA